MKTIKRFLVLATIGSSVVFASCKKDDNDDKNIVKRSGLTVTTNQENPPVTNSTASGVMNVSYNKKTRILTYDVSWLALSDTITGSHIHGTAPRGANAPVKVPFDIPNKGAKTGSYSGTAAVDGNLIKEDSLLKGFYYINIHTKKNPGGEIRGQIEF